MIENQDVPVARRVKEEAGSANRVDDEKMVKTAIWG